MSKIYLARLNDLTVLPVLWWVFSIFALYVAHMWALLHSAYFSKCRVSKVLLIFKCREKHGKKYIKRLGKEKSRTSVLRNIHCMETNIALTPTTRINFRRKRSFATLLNKFRIYLNKVENHKMAIYSNLAQCDKITQWLELRRIQIRSSKCVQWTRYL